MVNFIKRDKNDIYSKPILGFLFKNQKFLMSLKLVVLALFAYAIYLGFVDTSKENTFTAALFWGIFWALFMVVTLPTFGRIFCGICPHGFMGKYITRFGLKKTMPKWMQNRYIGISLLVIGWWAINYMFPNLYKTAFGTATLFAVMTLLSFVVYFLYKDMSYCKYICPIGTLTRAYSKLSFTWLGTYKKACDECKTFDCAAACPHNLKPFTFDGRNSMTDCTLCMDCSSACEAVSFKFKKPAFSLFSKFQILKAEIWAFIFILASIPITMSFHHGIGRSAVAGDMIWSKTAEFLKHYVSFGPIDPIGLFAFIYAILFTVIAAVLGMFIASKILQKDFSKVFYDLGYSYAPLFILGSIAHSLETFFTRGSKSIVDGFGYAFGFSVDVAPLASRGDNWLHIFGLLKWVAVIWAFIILYKRMKLLDSSKIRKIFAYIFASSLIIFFISVNLYRGYIMSAYPKSSDTHSGRMGNMSKKYTKGKSERGKGSAMKITAKPDANDVVYLDDENPVAKKGGSYGGMGMYGGRNFIPTKKFWPVFESEIGKLNCLGDIEGELYLLDANLTTTELQQSEDKGCKSVGFKVPENGYYNLFYINKQVKNDTLYLSTAKYEYLRYNHGKVAYNKDKMSAHTIKEVPFDILRLREEDNEKFYHAFYSGDTIKLKVLLDSQPIEGAYITLSTKTGWSKTIKTDKDGIASFVLIKDYFPQWDEFDRRYKNKFIVSASYTKNTDGKYLSQKYTKVKYLATYPALYYPGKEDYESYSYALLFATATALISGFVIYWYRKRRQKPFKEVRL